MVYHIGKYEVCPYGHLSWMVPITTFFGCILYLIGAYKCFTFIAKGEDPGEAPYEIWVGYWGLEDKRVSSKYGPTDDGNDCKGWGQPELFDGAWKFGRSVGPLGTFMSLSLFFIDHFLFYVPLPALWILLLAICHFITCILAGFLLWGLKSRICNGYAFNCTIGPGAICAIISCALWFLSFLMMLCIWKMELAMGGGGYRQRPRPAIEDGHDEIEEDDDEEQAPRKSILPAPPRNLTLTNTPKRTSSLRKAKSDRDIPLAIDMSKNDQEEEDDEDEDNDVSRNSKIKPFRRIQSAGPTTTPSSSFKALVHRKSVNKRTDMAAPKSPGGVPKSPAGGPPRRSTKRLSNSAHNSGEGSSDGGSSSRALTRRNSSGDQQQQQQQRRGSRSPRPGSRSPRPGVQSRNSVPANLRLTNTVDDATEGGDSTIQSMAKLPGLPPPPLSRF